MATRKEKRTYRDGLEFSNLEFLTKSERSFVQANVKRIAGRIKQLRKEKGLSQEKLAELTSISISTIKFIEQSQRAPSLPMFFKILFVLDPEAKIWP